MIGSLSDRLGRRRLLIASAIEAGLLFLPQAFVHEPRALIVWQFCTGFAVGGALSTLTALLAQFTPAGHEGVVFGLDSSAVAGANALGPIMGATVAAQMGLRAPFVLATLMFGVGTLAVVLWVREQRPGSPSQEVMALPVGASAPHPATTRR